MYQPVEMVMSKQTEYVWRHLRSGETLGMSNRPRDVRYKGVSILDMKIETVERPEDDTLCGEVRVTYVGPGTLETDKLTDRLRRRTKTFNAQDVVVHVPSNW